MKKKRRGHKWKKQNLEEKKEEEEETETEGKHRQTSETKERWKVLMAEGTGRATPEPAMKYAKA